MTGNMQYKGLGMGLRILFSNRLGNIPEYMMSFSLWKEKLECTSAIKISS